MVCAGPLVVSVVVLALIAASKPWGCRVFQRKPYPPGQAPDVDDWVYLGLKVLVAGCALGLILVYWPNGETVP